jgi:hypothetical protein
VACWKIQHLVRCWILPPPLPSICGGFPYLLRFDDTGH